MSNINYPAAFPWADPNTDNGESGMSLRDWFAGQALVGMTTGAHGDTVSMGGLMSCAEEAGKSIHAIMAAAAYAYADSMLKAREA